MKLIRKDFPKIRVRIQGKYTYYQVDCRQADWLASGGKQFENFSTKEEAVTRAQEIADLVDKNGKKAVIQDREIQAYRDILTRIVPYNITLDEVVADWIENRSHTVLKGHTKPVRELAELWLAEKKANKLKRLSDKTLQEVEYTVKQLTSFLGETPVGLVEQSKIEYIYSVWEANDVSLNTIKRNYGKMFKSFFQWCIGKEFIKTNPCDKIEIVTPERETKIYKIEEVETIFVRLKTEDKNRHLTPYVVLTLLCGLRPNEARQIAWGNINFKTNQIIVPGTISKRRMTRHFEMPENVIAWLKPWQEKLIYVEKNFRKRFESLTRELTQQQDICRHTAISYWVHKHEGNKEQVSLWMGNEAATINTFYLQGVSKSDVDRFFNIFPNYTKDDLKKIQTSITAKS